MKNFMYDNKMRQIYIYLETVLALLVYKTSTYPLLFFYVDEYELF